MALFSKACNYVCTIDVFICTFGSFSTLIFCKMLFEEEVVSQQNVIAIIKLFMRV